MYILAQLLPLRRLCTCWCSILFSGQRSFVILCCDTRMYVRLWGCPVVLDIELFVSAWYHKTRRVLLRARRLLLLLLLSAESKERRLAVCGITFKLASNGAETKYRFLANQHQKIPPHSKHPRLKQRFFRSRNPMYLVACCDKHKWRYLWHVQYASHRAPTHLPAGIDGGRTHASTSLMRASAGILCFSSKCDWHSRSLKKPC